tara:strand:- start:1026 stop:1211 length:186 start_codon:yes stop_codon:yes gene_type:complete
MNDSLVEKYEELKVLVETLQVDIVKNASGNKSAGVRARKSLRELKKIASEIVKNSLSADKK